MSSPAHVQPEADPSGEGGAPLEILVLDDMATDRMRLKRLCRRAGLNARIAEARDYPEFVAALDGPAIDIAFLDYHLGIETGLDAMSALNAHPDQGGAIAIMVSSLDDLSIAIEAMRMGCADYINKEELSVDAIRKSIALAFERRLLVSSLSDARSSERALRVMLTRIARTCGHEIRTVIGATMDQARAVAEGHEGIETSGLSTSLQRLDRICGMLSGYLRELADEDDAEGPRPRLIGE